ncbi:unnamed protein product [Trichogramma brassicae]|uniref:Uncharacterized protein n=1 Tax=Trichogramma brassicae TaxID=86971 RepID=A0A6H5IZ14_9HYME|nr:unnamed protein product [Trichogramma brassicae]
MSSVGSINIFSVYVRDLSLRRLLYANLVIYIIIKKCVSRCIQQFALLHTPSTAYIFTRARHRYGHGEYAQTRTLLLECMRILCRDESSHEKENVIYIFRKTSCATCK